MSGVINSTKQFVWATGKMVEERNSSGAITAQYFRYGETIGGASCYWTRDYLGSIREMTNSAGAIVDQRMYDPYGRVNQIQGSIPSDFQYAGYYAHASSGLYLTLNRFYNSVLGRWLSRDPIGENGGTNLYDYVGNCPISRNDPSGMSYKYDCGDPAVHCPEKGANANGINPPPDGICYQHPSSSGAVQTY
jgi:RHS repeat-associated protein